MRDPVLVAVDTCIVSVASSVVLIVTIVVVVALVPPRRG